MTMKKTNTNTNTERWNRKYYAHFPGFGTVRSTKSHLTAARSSGWSFHQAKKRSVAAAACRNALLLLALIFLLFVCIILLGWINDTSVFSNLGHLRTFKYSNSLHHPKSREYPPLYCAPKSITQTCPNSTVPIPSVNLGRPSAGLSCPEYFRWIHEDLRPWKETGVTREMLEKARKNAHFRVVILRGRVYVEKYRKAIQTRDKFTLWGILQLLRWYPGRLPDLELLFDCDDRPVVPSKDFRPPNSGPPPLFRYCSDWMSLDIVFPDWSFWSWVETNLKPWRNASMAIQEGNMKKKWEERSPYAYWKGNPNVSPIRADLIKCNVSDTADWNTRLYLQDWIKQAKEGFNESNLENQCTHRYKIYVEGWAWSVSEKYIFACDAMTLVVRPHYHQFFARGMLPLQHYWPIREEDKCKSLKFAVEWGNNHTRRARAIGESGSRYILEDVKMELVYDYMYHLLNEYAKLLRFKPEAPPGAVELCSDTMACQEEEGGPWRKSMEESLETSPADYVAPCNLPPPYNPIQLRAFLDKKANLTRQVEMWEDEYWASSSIASRKGK